MTGLSRAEGRSSLLLLSQEEYAEHRSAVTHCRFNPHAAQVVATSDVDGVVKSVAFASFTVDVVCVHVRCQTLMFDVDS